jgi:hypothetical protein
VVVLDRNARSAIYEIVTPLSTGYTCPVTIRDSSEARKTARLAKSASNYDPFDLIELTSSRLRS